MCALVGTEHEQNSRPEREASIVISKLSFSLRCSCQLQLNSSPSFCSTGQCSGTLDNAELIRVMQFEVELELG